MFSSFFPFFPPFGVLLVQYGPLTKHYNCITNSINGLEEEAMRNLYDATICDYGDSCPNKEDE